MFGLFLAALDIAVLKELGTAARRYMRKQIGMIYDDDEFEHHEIYDHDEFYVMLQAAMDYSDLDQETLLLLCGTELFGLCQSVCYTDITLWGFLHNLESISGYANDVSSFHCQYIEDDNGVLLQFYYQWKGLEIIAIGFIKAVAKNIYSTSVEMKIEELIQKSKRNSYVASFSIKDTAMLDSSTSSCALNEDNTDKKLTETNCLLNDDEEQEYSHLENAIVKWQPVEPIWPITAEVFNELFPFNIVFDKNLTICAIGSAFFRLCPSMIGCYFTDFFEICIPAISCTYDNVVLCQSDTFYVRCQKHCSMQFKGKMFVNAMSKEIAYICTPVVGSLEDMGSCSIFVSDFFYLVNCQEAIFLDMHLTTARRVRKSLETAKQSLHVNQLEIEAEKQRSLDLLHSILPSFAINGYLKGEEFEPTRYDNVTVLFSDIEDFANICDYYEPLEAVKLLDSLFSEFDLLSEQYGVFKLESYNDVYIIADTDDSNSNCPRSVLAMAVAMRKKAMATISPNTMEFIKVRIGIHTGPVVAAVLNKNMPHFCIFGHTVNKASRMCTHGSYGKIHVSAETHDVLFEADTASCQYQFECRGKIPVKGLGNLVTYFVEPCQGFETKFYTEHTLKCNVDT